MSDTVVDSSVVAKWVLPEPDSAHAERLIAEVALKGERLIVLDLAFVEVTNAIWKRHHRGLATLDETRAMTAKQVKAYFAQTGRRLRELTGQKLRAPRQSQGLNGQALSGRTDKSAPVLFAMDKRPRKLN
jgi:hypothetical protein